MQCTNTRTTCSEEHNTEHRIPKDSLGKVTEEAHIVEVSAHYEKHSEREIEK